MPTRRDWTRDELLTVFRFYCQTPFGHLDARRREMIDLARLLDRTPGSVAMKACNFASLDPVQRARGIKGLSGASAADRALWEEFAHNSEAVANAAEEAYERLTHAPTAPALPEFIIPDGPTEIVRTIRARRVQRFFAAAVYTAYEGKCALTGLAIRELLNASHIIPWSEDERRRAHPSNGILLNVLYDRAFDRHLITFDDNLRVIVSPKLKQERMENYQRDMVARVEGQQLRMPTQFEPDMEAVRSHRGRFSSAAVRAAGNWTLLSTIG